MKTQLKYTLIKSDEQYDEYCSTLHDLHSANAKMYRDEIELLLLLIERWEQDNNLRQDPMKLLHSIMEHNLN